MAPTPKINKRAIAKMTQEIQREFDRNPIRIPVEGDTDGLQGGRQPAPQSTIVHNAPVINIQGDGAQIAYGTQGDVSQNSKVQEKITSGYEPVAQAIAKILEGLPDVGLAEADQKTVRDEADQVMSEVTKDTPDQDVIKRGATLVKGALSPVAIGAQEAVSESAKSWASMAIKLLTDAIVFQS